jgi:hypothetical protein
MSSIIGSLFTAAFAVIVVMIPPSLAFADDPAGVEHDRPAAGQTVGVAGLPRPPTEAFRGVVASVDERNDTIKIRRSPETADEFRVQDGLLFNAVRYGDQVEVIVEKIDGARTIIGLMKR